MPREMINNLLFGTVEENAERELSEYKPGRGRKKDLGDYLGDFITGRGAAIDREVEKQYVDELENTYGTTLKELSTVPGLNVPTITKDTNADRLKQTVNLLTPKYQAIKTALQTSGQQGAIVDPNKFTTPEAIYAETQRQVREQEEKKYKRRRDESKDDLKETRLYNKGLLDQQDLKEEKKEARASLERAENRRLTAETNQMNLQLKYAELAANDRYRREDKREKALLALLNGLGNLGAAFTI